MSNQKEILASLDGRRMGFTSEGNATFKGAGLQEFRGDVFTLAATSLTLTDQLTGSLIVCTSSSSVVITVPGTLAIGFNIMLFQSGTGSVTPIAGGGMTLVNGSGFTQVKGRYSVASIVVYAAGQAFLAGDCA